MEAKKIFYIDHSIDFSGGQKSLLALLARLNRGSFKPVVILDKKAKSLAGELKEMNVESIAINFYNVKRLEILLFPLVMFRLFLLVKKEKCLLLHANTFKTGFICALLSRIIGVPTIFRSRLGIVVNSHGLVDKVIYLCSDVILANSSYVKRTYFERFGEDQKVCVVYNPLFPNYSLDRAVVEKLKAKFFSEPLFYYGVIGRIEPFKRQHEIIEAARYLLNWRKDFKVVFFGNSSLDGGEDYKAKLLNLISEYKLNSYFEFAGFVMEINEATSLLDCVLLCTEGEPLSRSIFESQFLNVPVIASNSGGNVELIEDGQTGLLYELNNPVSLAEKMREILESPELRCNIVSNANSFVRNRFDPAKTVEEEERVYVEVLKKSDKEGSSELSN